MAFKDGNSPSLGSKLALVFLTFVGLVLGIRQIIVSPDTYVFHNWSLIGCVIIFWARLTWSLFAYIKRKVSWFEGIAVGIGYGGMVYGFSSWGIQVDSPVLWLNIFGIILFALGSFINSYSDYQRDVWKQQPENKGRIYTEGLFNYAMHINYSADSLMFIGFAVVTQNVLSFIPPLVIILNLIFLQVPKMHEHLENKYGNEFLEYKRSTKRFIPFIY
jgi:protein-S-isoprenylcysteine O-methyltransferase Ste14